MPSTIGAELATNPFMRVGCAAVQAYAEQQDPVRALAEIRRRKTGQHIT